MPSATAHFRINGQTYSLVRELGGGLFHDASCVELEGTKYVLRRYKASYSAELENQWATWRNAGVGGSTDLVGYHEAGTLERAPYLIRRWVEGEAFDAFARRLEHLSKFYSRTT